MFKTGLVGNPTRPLSEIIFRHPGFKITGCFYPENNGNHYKNISKQKLPELSKEILLEKNDVLIFNNTGPCTIELLSEALKQSRQIMLMDIGGLPGRSIAQLIKLQEEARTVVQAKQIERSNPALHACLSFIVHPCLIEINLRSLPSEVHNNTGSVAKMIFRMLDALLFISPFNIQKIQTVRHPASKSSSFPVSARIEFDNGSVANLLFINMAEKKSFTIDIYQKNKLFKIDMLRQKLFSLEKSLINNKVNSKILRFKNTTDQVFYNELDNFYQSIINKNHSGKELFEVFRMAEISLNIIQKAGFS